jgi:uncharacterized protein YheU (UPF0270 family)
MIIPYQALQPDTLTNLIEEFVLREGTDYGHGEYPLDKKVAAVRRQLERNEVVVVFDSETETCNIVPRLAPDNGPA